MAGNNIRLIKIASEINIGKDAIVEFLQGKGFSIENKPTAVLSDEMADAIYDKFKKEKKAAEKQREKIEKHKQIRKTSDPKKVGDESKGASDRRDSSSVDKDARKDFSSKISAGASLSEKLDARPVQSAPIQMQAGYTPAVGDVIQLPVNSNYKSSRRDRDSRDNRDGRDGRDNRDRRQFSKDDNRSSAPVAAPAKAPVSAEKVETKEVRVEKKTKSPEKESTVTKIKLENLETSGEILTPDAYVHYDGDDEIIDVEIDNIDLTDDDELVTPAIPGAPKKDDPKVAKKKKKRKKIAEVEFEAGDSPKLKGLTIVGKIDLKAAATEAAKPKKDKVKKVGGAEEDEETRLKNAKSKSKNNKNKKVGVKPISPTTSTNKNSQNNKKKKKLPIREMISDEDVDKAIKQTLSEMGDSTQSSARNKLRNKKKAEREEKETIRKEEEAKEANILHLTEFVTTADMAKMIGVTANEIILKCIGLGLMVSINQRLDKDTITVIADDYGLEVEFFDDKAIQAIDEYEDDEEDLMPRSPIVTIMGHVDHGKTSLLDYIRSANVVAGEAGGITQHIGAYRVELANKKFITFLDTPGHEAFTAMRARGAQITDIVILVVAADDSVMPQTEEAISHALAAGVPIVVAINKIDKPDAQPDRIKQQLADHNILVEEWGGKYQSVEISAKKGINIDTLLEKVLLEAEMLELKANPDRQARATVVESNMTKGLGPVCTVIVQKGTLSIGDSFVVGHQYGRVRALLGERGNKLESAGPSIPARVIGLNGLPEAGDILTATDNDVEARNIATDRQQLRRQQEFNSVKHITLDDFSKKIQEGEVKDLYLVIKGDVGGSVEALSDSLQRLSNDEVRVNIIHKGVGAITESDVTLAMASGAIVIGFQVSPSAQARRLAESESVDVRLYSIIYDCIDEVRRALEGLLTPELKEDITCSVEVRKVFKISKIGVIAGCYMLSGKITRNDKVRLLRNGAPVFTGYLDSLKRGKDDVREVDSGYECGIALDGYNGIEVGDIIEGFKVVEIKRKLQ
jgi:translation initiation factor IF-2